MYILNVNVMYIKFVNVYFITNDLFIITIYKYLMLFYIMHTNLNLSR